MAKIKNTNSYPEKLNYNGVIMPIPAFAEMEVSEMFLGNLPNGVIRVNENEQMLLIEPDMYTSKEVKKEATNTTNLLLEEKEISAKKTRKRGRLKKK